MKTQHAIFLFFAGFTLELAGTVGKILHLAGTENVLLVATAAQVTGAFVFLYKVMSNSSVRNFWGW